MRFLLGIFLAVLPAGAAFANPAALPYDFEALKRLDVNYQIEGAVCEQVAKLRLEREFQPQAYEIVTGISYGDRTRTIGELDVVIFERRSGAAVVVAEVKCWKDLAGARKKATEQQRRFALAMRQPGAKSLFFATTSRSEIQYRPDQFMRAPRLIAISQSGGERAGFERALDHTLDEFKLLRERLLECHLRNKCSWQR